MAPQPVPPLSLGIDLIEFPTQESPPLSTSTHLIECPIQENLVPTLPTPTLTDNELMCEEVGIHLQRNLRNSVLLSTLVSIFRVPIPVEFEYRLSGTSDSEQEQGDSPNITQEYWVRIADTSAKLFLLGVAGENYVDENFQDQVPTMWDCYYTAVRYAIEIDADSCKSHLVVLLDQALADCGAAAQILLEQIIMPEWEEESETPGA